MINFNKVVKTYSTGFIKDKTKERRVHALSFYQKYKENAQNDVIQESMEGTEAKYEKHKITQRLNSKFIGQDKTKHINKIFNEGKEIIFKSIMTEMFIKSLFLDEAFINENVTSLSAFISEELDNRGGFSLLESAIAKTDSGLLKDIKSVCLEVTKEVARRKMTTDVENIDIFDINSNEDRMIDYGKDKLNVDNLTDLVKQKVLTVVQDEQKKSEEREGFFDDLKSELSTDDNTEVSDEVKEKEAIKESIDKILHRNGKTKSKTLFEALMENSYKEMLENVASMQNEDNDTSDYDVSFTADEASKNDKDHSDTIDSDFYDLPEPENKEKDDSFSTPIVDMDFVLAESITKYTVLELFNTIKLDELTHTRTKAILASLEK